MPENQFTPAPSETPTQVVLSIEEWNEIEDSVIALHAAILAGCASDDEAGELLIAVYRRISEALSRVRRRI